MQDARLTTYQDGRASHLSPSETTLGSPEASVVSFWDTLQDDLSSLDLCPAGGSLRPVGTDSSEIQHEVLDALETSVQVLAPGPAACADSLGFTQPSDLRLCQHDRAASRIRRPVDDHQPTDALSPALSDTQGRTLSGHTGQPLSVCSSHHGACTDSPHSADQPQPRPSVGPTWQPSDNLEQTLNCEPCSGPAQQAGHISEHRQICLLETALPAISASTRASASSHAWPTHLSPQFFLLAENCEQARQHRAELHSLLHQHGSHHQKSSGITLHQLSQQMHAEDIKQQQQRALETRTASAAQQEIEGQTSAAMPGGMIAHADASGMHATRSQASLQLTAEDASTGHASASAEEDPSDPCGPGHASTLDMNAGKRSPTSAQTSKRQLEPPRKLARTGHWRALQAKLWKDGDPLEADPAADLAGGLSTDAARVVTEPNRGLFTDVGVIAEQDRAQQISASQASPQPSPRPSPQLSSDHMLLDRSAGQMPLQHSPVRASPSPSAGQSPLLSLHSTNFEHAAAPLASHQTPTGHGASPCSAGQTLRQSPQQHFHGLPPQHSAAAHIACDPPPAQALRPLSTFRNPRQGPQELSPEHPEQAHVADTWPRGAFPQAPWDASCSHSSRPSSRQAGFSNGPLHDAFQVDPIMGINQDPRPPSQLHLLPHRDHATLHPGDAMQVSSPEQALRPATRDARTSASMTNGPRPASQPSGALTPDRNLSSDLQQHAVDITNSMWPQAGHQSAASPPSSIPQDAAAAPAAANIIPAGDNWCRAGHQPCTSLAISTPQGEVAGGAAMTNSAALTAVRMRLSRVRTPSLASYAQANVLGRSPLRAVRTAMAHPSDETHGRSITERPSVMPSRMPRKASPPCLAYPDIDTAQLDQCMRGKTPEHKPLEVSRPSVAHTQESRQYIRAQTPQPEPRGLSRRLAAHPQEASTPQSSQHAGADMLHVGLSRPPALHKHDASTPQSSRQMWADMSPPQESSNMTPLQESPEMMPIQGSPDMTSLQESPDMSSTHTARLIQHLDDQDTPPTAEDLYHQLLEAAAMDRGARAITLTSSGNHLPGPHSLPPWRGATGPLESSHLPMRTHSQPWNGKSKYGQLPLPYEDRAGLLGNPMHAADTSDEDQEPMSPDSPNAHLLHEEVLGIRQQQLPWQLPWRSGSGRQTAAQSDFDPAAMRDPREHNPDGPGLNAPDADGLLQQLCAAQNGPPSAFTNAAGLMRTNAAHVQPNVQVPDGPFSGSSQARANVMNEVGDARTPEPSCLLGGNVDAHYITALRQACTQHCAALEPTALPNQPLLRAAHLRSGHLQPEPLPTRQAPQVHRQPESLLTRQASQGQHLTANFDHLLEDCCLPGILNLPALLVPDKGASQEGLPGAILDTPAFWGLPMTPWDAGRLRMTPTPETCGGLGSLPHGDGTPQPRFCIKTPFCNDSPYCISPRSSRSSLSCQKRAKDGLKDFLKCGDSSNPGTLPHCDNPQGALGRLTGQKRRSSNQEDLLARDAMGQPGDDITDMGMAPAELSSAPAAEERPRKLACQPRPQSQWHAIANGTCEEGFGATNGLEASQQLKALEQIELVCQAQVRFPNRHQPCPCSDSSCAQHSSWLGIRVTSMQPVRNH